MDAANGNGGDIEPLRAYIRRAELADSETSGRGSNSSTRTAATRVCDSVFVSEQDGPNSCPCRPLYSALRP